VADHQLIAVWKAQRRVPRKALRAVASKASMMVASQRAHDCPHPWHHPLISSRRRPCSLHCSAEYKAFSGKSGSMSHPYLGT